MSSLPLDQLMFSSHRPSNAARSSKAEASAAARIIGRKQIVPYSKHVAGWLLLFSGVYRDGTTLRDH
jgi:hypothetical protein